jgi:hypothetical protein
VAPNRFDSQHTQLPAVAFSIPGPYAAIPGDAATTMPTNLISKSSARPPAPEPI